MQSYRIYFTVAGRYMRPLFIGERMHSEQHMWTNSFLGKSLDLHKAKQLDTYQYNPPGETDDEYASCEIYLNDFDCETTDSMGRNAYSILIYLDGTQIVKIVRIGHCHMCGGQGSDDELTHFPHQTLEKEAQGILAGLIKAPGVDLTKEAA